MQIRGSAHGPLVRERHRTDLPACVSVLRAVHREDGYPTDWPADPPGWLGGDTYGTAWVARWDERVVGHIALVRPDGGDIAPGLLVPGTQVGVVSRLFVDPVARGHRIGALLLARSTEHARAHGERAVLDVVDTDTAAIGLYERLGWVFLGTGQQEWGPDRWVSVRCYAAPVARGSAPKEAVDTKDPEETS
ncbi:GNAT family N-acetyltransferase [Streptomyces sp. SID8379]|uniref:GNAT family N-acetyltransferase n=1 Tax=unclassified Streptomyces TaxID=2593676 RepID=UPI00036D5E8B|nr:MULTISPECIES: GNAT family N-acetyltransferase [unclassified Streptomyces]MYW66984.1 GNAT family N-acetyltransferase [Streptomyces sp. SID8379]